MGIRSRWREVFGTAVPEQQQQGEARSALSFDDWLSYFSYNGNQYGIRPSTSYLGSEQSIGSDFVSYVTAAYMDSGPVFACMLARLMLFSEARFQYRRFANGRPGALFGDANLSVLHRPWPGGTTGDLLAGMIADADLAGNAFIYRDADRLRRLRPDWTTIVYGSGRADASPWDLDAEVIGYLYQPGGPTTGKDPVAIVPERVAHFMPVPDPLAPGRGMSWLTPVLREIMSDTAATVHKQKFFENGATVNLAVQFDPTVSKELFDYAVEAFNEGHEGLDKAYKTLFLLGATAQPIGSDLGQIDFKQVQGAGETRIAAAAGVPPVIVGLSEGLQAATYSNYSQARRRFADGTMRPLWRNAAASLAKLVPVPAGAELWYDARDIAFLAEDAKDAAEVQQVQAVAIKALIDAGYDAATVVDAITSGDMTRLTHTGLFSVQLQPPMPDGPTPTEANGAAAGRALAALAAPYLDAHGKV